jgi:probable HAF family extracellular repeat protein
MYAFRFSRAVLSASVLAGLCVSADAGIRYAVTLLPDVSWDNYFYPVAMNNKGEVVGKAWNDHGYIWRPGAGYAWLGQPFNLSWFNPSAINDYGQVVGTVKHAFGTTIIGYLKDPVHGWVVPSSADSLTDISSNGHIAGEDVNWDGWALASYWESHDSLMTTVSTSIASQSKGVNASGTVCGYYYPILWDSRAFVWTSAGGMHALPVPADTVSSQALSINDSGQIAGSITRTSDNRSHAVLWTGGPGPLDLGTLGGEACANAVNNAGQVVGYSRIAGGAALGFIHFNNHLFDLNTMTVAGSPTIVTTIDINDVGQILAYTSAGYAVLTPAYMANADFQAPLTGNWNVSGLGSAQTVEYGGAGQYVARLTAGSPVTISQNVVTPPGPFELAFDYQFLSTDPLCELTVSLAGVEVGSLTAPSVLSGGMTTESWMITDPALRGLDAASLSFTYDGPSGSQGYLDNITITQTPEPASLTLLLVGGLAMISRRK